MDTMSTFEKIIAFGTFWPACYFMGCMLGDALVHLMTNRSRRFRSSDNEQ